MNNKHKKYRNFMLGSDKNYEKILEEGNGERDRDQL